MTDGMLHRTILGAAVALTSLAAHPALAQRVDPGGRTLRNPGQPVGRPGAAPGGPAPAAPAAVAATGPRPYSVSLVPLFGWSDGTQSPGAQLGYSTDLSDNVSVGVSGAGRVIRSDGNNNGRAQIDAEIDVTGRPGFLRRRVTLVVAVEGMATATVGTFAEASSELAVQAIERRDDKGNVLGLLTLGVVGYLDRFAPKDGDATSGPTGGISAVLAPVDGLGLRAEYDFKSDFNGEDTFGARATVRLSSKGPKPVLILGAGKHKSFLVGLNLTLRER